MKKRIIISICISLSLIILMSAWGVSFSKANTNCIKIKEEFYKMGDMVSLDDNFMVDKKEQSQGYSMRINSVTLKDYREIYKQYGLDVDEELYNSNTPQDVILVNFTISNEGNKDGVLFIMTYSLSNGALRIPVDYMLFSAMDESYNGEYHLKILPNTSVDITIPFVPEPYALSIDKEDVYKKIKNESFFFTVCEYPVRKMIEVSV